MRGWSGIQPGIPQEELKGTETYSLSSCASAILVGSVTNSVEVVGICVVA